MAADGPDDTDAAAVAARFAFRCPRTLRSLTPTASPDVRHCDACHRDVVACADLGAATARAAHGACVAVAVTPTAPQPQLRPKLVGMLDLRAGDPTPVVSWLVPLDGASAGHTLPLAPGVTTLGVDEAQIEIVSTPDGCAVRRPPASTVGRPAPSSWSMAT